MYFLRFIFGIFDYYDRKDQNWQEAKWERDGGRIGKGPWVGPVAQRHQCRQEHLFYYYWDTSIVYLQPQIRKSWDSMENANKKESSDF